MKSMTGYGRGESSRKGVKVTVELSSVNRKQTEISVNLPRDLEVLEGQVRDEINRLVSRGRITVRISVHAGDDAISARVHVNLPLARQYARDFAALARGLKMKETITLDHLLRAPGVLQPIEEFSDAEELWPATKAALDQALAQLVQMRTREGTHLAKDLRARMTRIRKATDNIAARAPKVAVRYREQLLERVRAAGVEFGGEAREREERIMREVVLFADRSDISEELTRLASHFAQFEDSLKSGEPVGRKLDFLTQEINREINTIGSKANDADISREVVEAKAELEKFREQVQNVE